MSDNRQLCDLCGRDEDWHKRSAKRHNFQPSTPQPSERPSESTPVPEGSRELAINIAKFVHPTTCGCACHPRGNWAKPEDIPADLYCLCQYRVDQLANQIMPTIAAHTAERDNANMLVRKYAKRAETADAERKRVQELQEHEDAEAAFMAKRGVLYNCTFIDGWTKVLDERDELKERVQELEGSLKKFGKDAERVMSGRSVWPDDRQLLREYKIWFESILSKEQTK